ncbi:hypothetical protein BC939DRAFT_448893 [Gamsiella multidivaricata]|uniref:uncharacterized protein n=1 Tax=Gamsiella multidivaricata TaxID=101098 RepID=UPI00221F6929|nr:uncharacterized protein BC939DRAFT_448893 [Gamsiella multidivaricata]KAG0354027.1 hypothetical protein BGZ54_001891 [Gamsiella multidivaricata]KAI7825156.1 hypothetical protein BC939DRAFT_448893 [Gamsiella multidivaricata]
MAPAAGDNTKTEASAPGSTAGPVGGHLTKKQRKEQFEVLGTLQTQLDVSVSLARNTVASWLNADAFSDDEGDNAKNSSGFAAATVIQPRQPGLGLGAKFISHKDQMRHVPMNAFESKLKRQLTGGIVQSEIQRAEAAETNALPDKYQEHKMMMAARRKELLEQAEDEEDSRTRNIGSINSSSGGGIGVSHAHTKAIAASLGSGSGFGLAAKSAVKTESVAGPQALQKMKKKDQEIKYKAAVHPAVLKAAPSEQHQVGESSSSLGSTTSKAVSTSGKKRPGDFFSMYMDERASKMAKKKKKIQAKADSDDD